MSARSHHGEIGLRTRLPSVACLPNGVLVPNKRPGAVLGEKFEKHGVWLPPVEDRNGPDALLQSGKSCLRLGDHPAGNCAILNHRRDQRRIRFADQSAGLVFEAFHIGQKQQTVGVKRSGDGTRRCITVDIVGFPSAPLPIGATTGIKSDVRKL